MYDAPSPCSGCQGRCKTSKRGDGSRPVWYVETKAIVKGTKNTPYFLESWDCPNAPEFLEYALMIRFLRMRRQGLPYPELTALGMDAMLYASEVWEMHSKWLTY